MSNGGFPKSNLVGISAVVEMTQKENGGRERRSGCEADLPECPQPRVSGDGHVRQGDISRNAIFALVANHSMISVLNWAASWTLVCVSSGVRDKLLAAKVSTNPTSSKISGLKMIQGFTELLHENEAETGRKGLVLIARAMVGRFHASYRVEQAASSLRDSRPCVLTGKLMAVFRSMVDFDDFQTAASDMAHGLARALGPNIRIGGVV